MVCLLFNGLFFKPNKEQIGLTLTLILIVPSSATFGFSTGPN